MAELTAQLAPQSERACGAQAQADTKAGLLADERALSSSLARENRALKRKLAHQVDPAVFWSLQVDIAFGTGCHLCTVCAHA